MIKLKKGPDLRIWLADLTHTGKHARSIGVDTFPLAVGCIGTYAERKLSLIEAVRIFRYPHKLAEALEEDGCPDIVGFSNFIWNFELSLAFSRRIKELRPGTIVVMGGANFPLERIKQELFLRSHPEVDFYIYHEGEVAFVDLVNRLMACNMDIEKVKQGEGIPSVLAVDKKGKPLPFIGSAERLTDLSQIPSPYTTGKFDEFFDGRLWPLIQTKRGCPFTCTYCTEGNKYYSKIARFGLDYTKAEIEYIGKKMALVRSQGGRSDIYIGDSNFGMYEEDLEIAKELSKTYNLYGWPDHINTSTGKNQKQRILEVARIVKGRIVLSGSVQTMDPVVLKNIKRENIVADQLMYLAREASDTDANSYCEVILGLPGESRESHFKTLRTVVNAGFNKVIPYQLMILSGSELATEETISKYGMKLRSRVLPRAFGVYRVVGKNLIVADIEDICVTNDTMTFDDYVECRMMHLVITIFYNDVIFGALLKAIRMSKLSVFRWLELIRDILPSAGLGGLFNEFRSHTENELWESRDDLEAFIQKKGTIEQYINGQLGFNLLYSFKARALTTFTESLVSIARDAVKRLGLEVFQRKPELGHFLDDVIRWDSIRMANILRDFEQDITDTFRFDISRFMLDPCPKKINSYAYRNSAKWRFILTDEQKDYINRNLNIFGHDDTGIGRILSNSPMKQLLRHPVIAGRSS